MRADVAAQILSTGEVGDAAQCLLHELLMRFQITGGGRHLLQHTAQIAGQRMLRQQLAEVLVDLVQPLGSRMQASVVGEMTNRLVRQVMRLIEYIEAVTRVGQNRAATQGQIRQHQVVIGDDDIDLLHALAGLVEHALLKVAAAAVAALDMVGGQPRPVLILQRLGPGVALTVPFVATERLDHASVEFESGLIHVNAEAVIGKDLLLISHRLVFAQQVVELGQADIAAAPLGQREAELETGVAQNIRQILENDLLLQRHGRSRNDQRLAQMAGNRNRR